MNLPYSVVLSPSFLPITCWLPARMHFWPVGFHFLMGKRHLPRHPQLTAGCADQQKASGDVHQLLIQAGRYTMEVPIIQMAAKKLKIQLFM